MLKWGNRDVGVWTLFPSPGTLYGKEHLHLPDTVPVPWGPLRERVPTLTTKTVTKSEELRVK